MVHSLRRDPRSITGRTLDQGAFGLLVLLAALFAFEQTQPLVRAGLFALTSVELLLALTIFLWFLSRLVAGRLPRIPRELWLPVAIWLVVLLLSTALAPAYQNKALLFMARVLTGVLIGWVAYDLADTRDRWLTLIVALVFGGVAVAALGLAEGLRLGPVVAWLDSFKIAPTRLGDVLRVSATLSYATITAMILELTLPLLLALALLARTVAGRLLAMASIILVLVVLVLTLSRAGILALLAALAVMALAGVWRRRRRLVVAALVTGLTLVLLVALVLFFNPTTRLRLITETEQSWYQVKYAAPESLPARPGQRITAPVRVTNTGARTWPATGELPYALAYHLYDDAGQSLTYDGPRSPLPSSVAPLETAVITAQINTPTEPGEYLIEWDMVQEKVTWFSWKNAPTARTTLVVSGPPAESTISDSSAPPTDIRIITPSPGRFELWRAALLMFVDYPILGVGPDSFRWQYGAYAGVSAWDTGIHANNLYIEWLADTGLVGLLLFLWFSWRLAKTGLARLDPATINPVPAGRPEMEEVWLLTLGLMAALVAWYVHGFFDYFYEFTPTYVAFWLLVALLVGVPRRRRDGVANRL